MRTLAKGFLFAVVLMAPTAARAGDADRVAGASRTAYEANRASLPFGTIRFKVVAGRVQSESEACQGAFPADRTADGVYAYDGTRGRFELIYRDQGTAPRAPGKAGSKSKPRRSIRVLTDGVVTLAESVSGLVIVPGTDQFFKSVSVPLDLGKPKATESLLRTMGVVDEGGRGCKLTAADPVRLDGEDTVRLTFEAPDFQNQFWVDLQRGALPVLTRSYNKDQQIYLIDKYDNIKYINGKGWYPFRSTSYYSFGTARQFSVVQADFDHPPDPSVFRLEFDKPRRVDDIVQMVRYKPRKVWTLSSLPSRYSPEASPLVIAPKTATAGAEDTMPGELDSSARRASYPLTFLGLGFFVAAAAVGYGKRHAGRKV